MLSMILHANHHQDLNTGPLGPITDMQPVERTRHVVSVTLVNEIDGSWIVTRNTQLELVAVFHM